MHLQQHISDKTSFVVRGKGPSYEDFKRVAEGLVHDVEVLPRVDHRFHFCIDGNHALVLWFCQGVLYQRQMTVACCRDLLDCLETSGFRCEELN